MTQAIFFMALVPLALLVVLAFVLLRSRMKEDTRKRVEIVLTCVIYPAVILSSAWQAWVNWRQGEWSSAGMMAALVGLFAIQFVLALRSRSLFPRFRNPGT